MRDMFGEAARYNLRFDEGGRGRMKPTNQNTQVPKVPTTRAEALRELGDEVIKLFSDSEKALLMAEDLVEEYFCPLAEDVGKQDRETTILFYFEEKRIRAEILYDILFKVKTTAEALYAEMYKTSKWQVT
jgi:hypothetical protein